MVAVVEITYVVYEEDFGCHGSADDHARAHEAVWWRASGAYVSGVANETWSGQANAWEVNAFCAQVKPHAYY
jgi:hypothetical protein